MPSLMDWSNLYPIELILSIKEDSKEMKDRKKHDLIIHTMIEEMISSQFGYLLKVIYG